MVFNGSQAEELVGPMPLSRTCAYFYILIRDSNEAVVMLALFPCPRICLSPATWLYRANVMPYWS